jgi:hypothetical protein
MVEPAVLLCSPGETITKEGNRFSEEQIPHHGGLPVRVLSSVDSSLLYQHTYLREARFEELLARVLRENDWRWSSVFRSLYVSPHSLFK